MESESQGFCARAYVTLTPAPGRTPTHKSQPDTLTSTPTSTPTPSLPPTTAARTSTPSPTVTCTPTIPAEAWLKFQCLDVIPSLLGGKKYSGVLVLAPSPVDFMAPAYLYDLASEVKTSLPQQEHEIVGSFSISPNRQWLAYENSTLFVVYPGSLSKGRTSLILWDQTEARELTGFTDFSFFPLEMPKWSPDGSKLAFWAILGASHHTNLAILDINSKMITNYCVSGDFSVWLPDGQQLVFGNENVVNKQWRTVLLDIPQGFAAVITDVSLNPISWMVSP